MKTSELTGTQLDYWVAKALAWDCPPWALLPASDGAVLAVPHTDAKDCDPSLVPRPFCPSTNWAQGGPIIEREKITVIPFSTGPFIRQESAGWTALVGEQWSYIDDGLPLYDGKQGQTLLIAAMRAYVASKFGEEVPDGE